MKKYSRVGDLLGKTEYIALIYFRCPIHLGNTKRGPYASSFVFNFLQNPSRLGDSICQDIRGSKWPPQVFTLIERPWYFRVYFLFLHSICFVTLQADSLTHLIIICFHNGYKFPIFHISTGLKIQLESRTPNFWRRDYRKQDGQKLGHKQTWVAELLSW